MFLDAERKSVISAFESLKVSGGLYQACSPEQEVWFPSWRTRIAQYQSLQHRVGSGGCLAAEARLQAQLTFTPQSAPTLMSCEVLNTQHSLADTDAPELQTPKENFQPSLSLHILGQTPRCSCQTELNSDQIIFTERRRRSAALLSEAVNSLETLWWICFLRTTRSGILLDRFTEKGCDGERGCWLVELVVVSSDWSELEKWGLWINMFNFPSKNKNWMKDVKVKASNIQWCLCQWSYLMNQTHHQATVQGTKTAVWRPQSFRNLVH